MDGVTPLHIAVLLNDIDLVELLLEYDADIMIRNFYGRTADELLHSPEPRKADIILNKLGIELPSATITGLRIAASQGRDVRIRQLLERGADINAKDEGGMTALLWADDKGHVSTMKLLVDNGPDVKVKSNWGTTPMSCEDGNAELEALLLANEYNLDTSNSKVDGTAEQQSEYRVLQEIRELLEDRMNEPSTADEDTLDGSGDPDTHIDL
jgi:ankyrin repeat protein